MKESEIKKTIDEWHEVTGIEVLDADGFDRKSPMLFNERFTLTEFMNGVVGSTVQCKVNPWIDLTKFISDIKLKLNITD